MEVVSIVPIQNGMTYLKNRVNKNSSFFVNVDNLKKENQELQVLAGQKPYRANLLIRFFQTKGELHPYESRKARNS